MRKRLLLRLIAKEANRFDTTARANQGVADDLADALEADPAPERDRAVSTVRRFAARHPNVLGTWVAHEPNAYDGRDADYVERDPFGDHAGRIAIWAQRADGPLKVEAFTDTNGKPWQDEDYYTQPMRARGDLVLDPYLDTGVSLKSLGAQAKAVKVLDSGFAYVAAPTGNLLAYPRNPKLAGTKQVRVPAAALHGKTGFVESGDDVLFYAPVNTGGWTFVAVAPKAEILAPVAALRTKLIVVGLLALLIVAGVLVLVAARIARPVRKVAEAAERIGDGGVVVRRHRAGVGVSPADERVDAGDRRVRRAAGRSGLAARPARRRVPGQRLSCVWPGSVRLPPRERRMAYTIPVAQASDTSQPAP